MTQINEEACRRAFEEWAPTQGCSVDKWQHGDLTGYGFPAVHSMWLAWRAAWAAREPEPVSVDLEAGASAIAGALAAKGIALTDDRPLAKACAEAWGLKWK
jgi:hypothetical protein